MGHQVMVPITGGALDLGPWEQVFYAEFDGQRRKRVIVKVMGAMTTAIGSRLSDRGEYPARARDSSASRAVIADAIGRRRPRSARESLRPGDRRRRAWCKRRLSTPLGAGQWSLPGGGRSKWARPLARRAIRRARCSRRPGLTVDVGGSVVDVFDQRSSAATATAGCQYRLRADRLPLSRTRRRRGTHGVSCRLRDVRGVEALAVGRFPMRIALRYGICPTRRSKVRWPRDADGRGIRTHAVRRRDAQRRLGAGDRVHAEREPAQAHARRRGGGARLRAAVGRGRRGLGRRRAAARLRLRAVSGPARTIRTAASRS